MTIERLRAVCGAQPFRPFRLHLADGRNLRVPHPEFLAMHPTGRTAIVFTGRDDFEVVDLLLVTSLEVSNGSRRKRV